ncbi:MAG: hypothetical protein V3U45_05330 [bacterium]
MSEHEGDSIDFSPLDPTTDEARFDEIVGGIVARAAGELSLRRARSTTIVQLARWRRPMLAAAALMAVISATILSQVGGQEAATFSQTDGVAEALGVPGLIAEWIETDELPSTADLLTSF